MKIIAGNLLLILFVFGMNNVTVKATNLNMKKEMDPIFFARNFPIIMNTIGVHNLEKIKAATTLEELEAIGFKDRLDNIFGILCEETGFVWRFEGNQDEETERFFKYLFTRYNEKGLGYELFKNIYNAWYDFRSKENSLNKEQTDSGSIRRTQMSFKTYYAIKTLCNLLANL